MIDLWFLDCHEDNYWKILRKVMERSINIFPRLNHYTYNSRKIWSLVFHSSFLDIVNVFDHRGQCYYAHTPEYRLENTAKSFLKRFIRSSLCTKYNRKSITGNITTRVRKNHTHDSTLDFQNVLSGPQQQLVKLKKKPTTRPRFWSPIGHDSDTRKS